MRTQKKPYRSILKNTIEIIHAGVLFRKVASKNATLIKRDPTTYASL